MKGGLRAVRLFFLYAVWFAKHFILVLVAAAAGFWTVHQKSMSHFPWNSTLPKSNEPALAGLLRAKIILVQCSYFFEAGIAPNLGILLFPLRWRCLLHPGPKGLKSWCSGFTPEPRSPRFQSKSNCTVLFSDLIRVAELHLASRLK